MAEIAKKNLRSSTMFLFNYLTAQIIAYYVEV